MSDGSQNYPPYNNGNTSQPTRNHPVHNNLPVNNGPPAHSSNNSTGSNMNSGSSQPVDEYAVLETLFYNEMKMMDSYYGNSGTGLLNNGELNVLIENNGTDCDNPLANNNSNSNVFYNNNPVSQPQSQPPPYAPSRGAKDDSVTNGSNHHGPHHPDPSVGHQMTHVSRNGVDVDQHARFLGSTTFPNMKNSNYNSKSPAPPMMRSNSSFQSSSTLQAMQQPQHHHQPQGPPPIQQLQPEPPKPPDIRSNQGPPAHMNSTKSPALGQQIQGNGQIHMTPQHRQHDKPHTEQSHIPNQPQQHWSSNPQMQQRSSNPQVQQRPLADNSNNMVHQIPSQPSIPTQNQHHSHQNHFNAHSPPQNGLATPILPHPPKKQDKNLTANMQHHQQPQHQINSDSQSHHSQHHQHHMNQIHHPLPPPVQRSPLNSPTLQLLTPSQQPIQNTHTHNPQQNQMNPQSHPQINQQPHPQINQQPHPQINQQPHPQINQQQHLQRHQEQSYSQPHQQARPLQQSYQLQSQGNHTHMQQSYHSQVQQLRQPPQLQPPHQYQSAQPPPQQGSHPQQHQYRSDQPMQQTNSINTHKQSQPPPQPQPQPQPQPHQQQAQKTPRSQQMQQPHIPMQPQPNTQGTQQYPYQQQHQSNTQKMHNSQPLQVKPQYIPQQQHQKTQIISALQEYPNSQQTKTNQSQQQKQLPNQVQSHQTQRPPQSIHQYQPKQQCQQSQTHQPQQVHHHCNQQQQPQLQHQQHNVQSQSKPQTQQHPQNKQHYPTNQQYVANRMDNKQHLQQQPPIPSTNENQSLAPIVSNRNHPSQSTKSCEQDTRQLVAQFAGIASKLGIRLPESVFSSLTKAATIREESRRNDNESKTNAKKDFQASVGNTRQMKGINGEILQIGNDFSLNVTTSVLPPSTNLIKMQSTTALQTAKKVEDNAKKTSLPTSSNPYTDVLKNPTILKLEETASAAIAAISSKTQDKVIGNNTNETNPADTSTCRAQLYTRKRKRRRLEDCVEKLAALRAENDTLKRHLAKVANKTQKFDVERDEAEKELRDIVKNGSTTEKMNNTVEKFTRMYSDFGQHRHEELSFHFEQLEKLAVPTNFTKMSLWTLAQNNEFFLKPKRNAISGILMEELGITWNQGRRIIEHRQKIKDICANLKHALSLLTTLKALCEHKQNVFQARITKCREILTPLQVCKFLVWIHDNWGLLEEVCPGWGSERVKKKSLEVDASITVTESEQRSVSKTTASRTEGNEFDEDLVNLQEIGAGDDTDDSSTGSLK